MKKDERSEGVRVRLGYKIRTLREAKGFSQDDLACRVGINRSYLSGIENGKRNLTIDILTRLADVLEISLSELLKDVDVSPRPISNKINH